MFEHQPMQNLLSANGLTLHILCLILNATFILLKSALAFYPPPYTLQDFLENTNYMPPYDCHTRNFPASFVCMIPTHICIGLQTGILLADSVGLAPPPPK